MVRIKVIRQYDGTLKEDARVSVYFGMLNQNSRDGRTNRNSEVDLDVPPGDYRVTINGSSMELTNSVRYHNWYRII